jgi:serine/threonine protein kinase
MLPAHHPQRAKLDQAIVAFDEAVRGGSEPIIDAWIADWPDPKSRSLAIAELLCTGCELRDFDYAWLASEFRRLALDLESRELRLGLLRALARDQLETSGRLEWNDFQPFGFLPNELDLRADEDPFPLGILAASRFSLRTRLGGGGFGVVYRATDAASGQTVVVKVPRRTSDSERHVAAERLKVEGSLLARFSGAHTPQFYETVVAEDGTPLLVMEYIAGGLLADKLQHGPVPIDEALRLTEQIALGLDESHQLGLVHRDLKPANVLLDGVRGAVLADFGVALDESQAAAQEGMIVGTPGRMSVEMLLGIVTELDGRADIWAMGGLLYEMITGEKLMEGKSREGDFVLGVLAGSHHLTFPTFVPNNVRRLVECAVSRDQKLRFDRAADIAAICRMLRADPTTEPRMPLVRPRLITWRLGLTMALARERLQQFQAGLAAHAKASDKQAAEARNSLAMALANGHGAAIAYDELRSVAAQVNIKLDAWNDAKALGSTFYRGSRLTADDVRQLAEKAPECERFLQSAYERLQLALMERFQGVSDLFEFGFQSGCSAWSSKCRASWPKLAEKAELPIALVESYQRLIDRAANEDQLRAGVVQLNRDVERHLRFTDEPEPVV